MIDFTYREVNIGDIIVYTLFEDYNLHYGIVFNIDVDLEQIEVIDEFQNNILIDGDFAVVSNVENNTINNDPSLIRLINHYKSQQWKNKLIEYLNKIDFDSLKNSNKANIVVMGNEREFDKIHFLSEEEVIELEKLKYT